MNCLSWAETLPYRVGEPKITASAQTMSSGSASGRSFVASALAAHAGLESIAACGASSRTFRSRTCAPASVAAVAMASAMRAMVPVEE